MPSYRTVLAVGLLRAGRAPAQVEAAARSVHAARRLRHRHREGCGTRRLPPIHRGRRRPGQDPRCAAAHSRMRSLGSSPGAELEDRPGRAKPSTREGYFLPEITAMSMTSMRPSGMRLNPQPLLDRVERGFPQPPPSPREPRRRASGAGAALATHSRSSEASACTENSSS